MSAVHNLSAKEIEDINPENNFVFDFGINVGEVSLKTYKNFFLESRSDPNKSIRQTFSEMDTAQIEIDGKMMDVNEYLRYREKIQREKIAKDNNIIEIDLLR